jgi:hypothetical protein
MAGLTLLSPGTEFVNKRSIRADILLFTGFFILISSTGRQPGLTGHPLYRVSAEYKIMYLRHASCVMYDEMNDIHHDRPHIEQDPSRRHGRFA